jgi:large subunit ribosomal protein L22
MKAKLSQHRQSPRKVRLVTDLIDGKSVDEALRTLQFSTKQAADPVAQLIESAIANAEENDGKRRKNLEIDSVTVDQGPTLKRFQPRAQGRSSSIKKRTSHITVKLAEKETADAQAS